MNWLDIVIIICVVIGVVHGLITGIVKQIIFLVSLLAAIILSRRVATWIGNWIQPHLNAGNSWLSLNIQNAIYYILAFVLIVSLFAIASKFIDGIINHTPAGFINNVLGALFGAFLWILCLSMAINFVAVFDTQSRLITKPTKENSIFYEKVKMIFPTVFPHIKDFIKHETNG